MKILQICSARQIGGGETHLAGLSNALAGRGHRIFFALAPSSPFKDAIANAAPENILFTQMRNALDVFSAHELAKFARQNEVEIIHAHLARDYPLAALAARLARKPFVITRHVLFPMKRLQKYALQNVSGIIAPSKAISAVLRRQNLFAPEKIETIHYGIEPERFTSVEKKSNANFTVGTIGHLAPIKGHDIFIRAAAIVLQKRRDIRFVIVGEDKSRAGENRREIENLIARLDLQTRVELAGWTDDVRPFLRKFDLFVSAARSEAFGLVMVEAMAARIPVIAAESEGAAEIIEDGASGILVPLENHEKLAEAILDLADHPARCERLGNAGRLRVEGNFSLEKMVSETEEFYRRVLQKAS